MIDWKYQLAIWVGLVAALTLPSYCTDAQRAQLGRFNSTQEINCYSGGAVVLSDTSTGKPSELTNGISYVSAKTGQYTQVYMDCVVQQKD